MIIVVLQTLPIVSENIAGVSCVCVSVAGRPRASSVGDQCLVKYSGNVLISDSQEYKCARV